MGVIALHALSIASINLHDDPATHCLASPTVALACSTAITGVIVGGASASVLDDVCPGTQVVCKPGVRRGRRRGGSLTLIGTDHTWASIAITIAVTAGAVTAGVVTAVAVIVAVPSPCPVFLCAVIVDGASSAHAVV